MAPESFLARHYAVEWHSIPTPEIGVGEVASRFQGVGAGLGEQLDEDLCHRGGIG